MDLTQYEQHRTSPALVGVLLFVVGLAGGYGMSQKFLKDKEVKNCETQSTEINQVSSKEEGSNQAVQTPTPLKKIFGKVSEINGASFKVETKMSSLSQNSLKSSVVISNDTKFFTAVMKDRSVYEKEMKDYTDKVTKMSASNSRDLSSLGEPPLSFSGKPATQSDLKDGVNVLVEAKSPTVLGDTVDAVKIIIVPSSK